MIHHNPKIIRNSVAATLLFALVLGGIVALALSAQTTAAQPQAGSVGYTIVDTGQTTCYDGGGSAIACPAAGQAFSGQDAQHTGNTPSYTDKGNGIIVDHVTGLMWQQSPDTNSDAQINASDKLTSTQAATYCQNLTLADYSDWRLPSIKQLYSLIDFSGTDPSGYQGSDTSALKPFINTAYFDFAYGDTTAGERIIDSQYASSTTYVDNTPQPLLFGVNFADGRIKGYGLTMPGGGDKTFFVMCVRGNASYGQNNFVDNQDGTITDQATRLMWAQNDSGVGLNWQQALAWVETQNAANYLGHSDWRLPNAKELQSLVDYTRAPDVTNSAAINTLFNSTPITNEAGISDYPAYWSSTTHVSWGTIPGTTGPGWYGVYVTFGRAMGYMNNTWVDVHGAGSQRSDPKFGDPADYPTGNGPQGDAIRIYNYVRLVRDTDNVIVDLNTLYLPLAINGTQPPKFTIDQTLSDGAQRNTIAFDALAFLTGSLGADSFFPPGKVADFWGFQYLRDNDPTEMGHNTDFLTRASLNMLYTLTPDQRAELISLAENQVDEINLYAYKRFVLMSAFRRLLTGDIPAGTDGLDQAAVQAYSAELYRLDGSISYQRAQVMGKMLTELDDTQRAYLDAMIGKGMLEWPVVNEPEDLRGLDHDVKVAVMTYAGDMFSWYAGSVEADTYFCPERQGTYFGSFYMKDAPAMGNPGYSIPPNLTAEMGEAFLKVLTPEQAAIIQNLVNDQKPALFEIVDRRTDVSTLLRQFMQGNTPDQTAVLALMERYGELDGEIVYRYATAFAQVGQSLSEDQLTTLTTMRTDLLQDLAYPSGAYLYAGPIPMPTIANTDFLFK